MYAYTCLLCMLPPCRELVARSLGRLTNRALASSFQGWRAVAATKAQRRGALLPSVCLLLA